MLRPRNQPTSFKVLAERMDQGDFGGHDVPHGLDKQLEQASKGYSHTLKVGKLRDHMEQ